MPTPAQLKAAVDAIEAQTSVRAGSGTDTSYWRRLALAMEEGAGVTNSASDTEQGWMLRAAMAAEAAWGGSGAEENSNYEGLLKRITDAVELNAGAGTGSLANRLATRASVATFVPDLPAGSLEIVNSSGTRVKRLADGWHEITGLLPADGGNANNAWNASAKSTTALTGDFLLSLQRMDLASSFSNHAGVATAPDTSHGIGEQQYAIQFYQNRLYQFMNGGEVAAANVNGYGLYVWVERINGVIRTYYGSGTRHTATENTLIGPQSIGGAMFFDCSFFEKGAPGAVIRAKMTEQLDVTLGGDPLTLGGETLTMRTA